MNPDFRGHDFPKEEKSKIGAQCSACGKGRYWPTGKRWWVEKETTKEKQSYIELECDNCGAKYHELVLTETLNVKG